MNEDSFSDINESRAKDNKWPTIPDYTIKSKIGQGGMGIVFLAHHELLGTKAAIKFIHDAQNGNDKQLRRFLQEARIVARLKHPYIATIYNMSRTREDKYYFAMEYVEGETLEEKIKQKNISIEEAVKITIAVLGVEMYGNGVKMIGMKIITKHQKMIVHG